MLRGPDRFRNPFGFRDATDPREATGAALMLSPSADDSASSTAAAAAVPLGSELPDLLREKEKLASRWNKDPLLKDLGLKSSPTPPEYASVTLPRLAEVAAAEAAFAAEMGGADRGS